MSLLNALEKHFTPASPIELQIRFKDRLERLMSLINVSERYLAPDSPI